MEGSLLREGHHGDEEEEEKEEKEMKEMKHDVRCRARGSEGWSLGGDRHCLIHVAR